MPSLVDDCLLGKDKFKNFLEVVETCEIKTGYDFVHFMSVVKEHCIDKGITDFDEVKKCWEEHKDSIEEIKQILFPKFEDDLLEEFDKEFFENGQDDDLGYYPECCIELDNEAYEAFEKEVLNNEIDQEKVKSCKKIFEGIDKVEVEIKGEN